MMDITKGLPLLSAQETRVLGCLIEKSKTTPEYYPLTLNALLTACNQKSSRNPVVQYDEAFVIQTLDELKRKGLVSTATGGHSRSVKYKHNLALLYDLDSPSLAALCLLMLRGPLTVGEINSNAGRLYEFEKLEEVLITLHKLMDLATPFVKTLPKRQGQKEQRYVHLLADFMESLPANAEEEVPPSNDFLNQRLSALEQEITNLKTEVEQLKKAWLE